MNNLFRLLPAVAALTLLAGGAAAATASTQALAATEQQAAPADYDQGYADGLAFLQSRDPQEVGDEIQKANYLLDQASTIREYDYLNGYLNGLQAY